MDPVSQAITKDKGIILYYDKQFDDAIRMAKTTLELDPEYPSAHRLLSLAYQAKGRFEEAIEENKIWGELTGNETEAKFCRAQIYAVSGREKETLALIEEIVQNESASDNVYRGLALVYAGLGDHDRAFQMLEKSYELREIALFSLKVDPKLESLHRDPRFEALLGKLGVA